MSRSADSGEKPDLSRLLLYVHSDRIVDTELLMGLQEHHYSIIEAKGAVAALNEIHRRTADIDRPVAAILCRLQLSDLSCIDFLQRLRRKNIAMPVVVLGYTADLATAIPLVREGAYDYLCPPFDSAKIAASIDRAIGFAVELRSGKETEMSLREKAQTLEQKTFSLGQANIELLGMKEQLEAKNEEMQTILTELSKRTDELQAILDTSPSVILMVDDQEKITAINRNVKPFFGIDSVGLIGKSFSEFEEQIAPAFADFEKYRQNFSELKKRLSEEGIENLDLSEFYNRASRLLTPHERMIVPIPALVVDESRREPRTIIVYNDITRLHAADHLVRTMLEASPIPFIVSRMDTGEMLYVNRPLANLVHSTPEEMIGKNLALFLSDADERERIIDQLSREGCITGHEVQIEGISGRPQWVLLSLVTAEMGSEKVLIGGLHDITIRKKTEEHLRLYRKIFVNSADPISILSPSGEIMEVNPAALALFEYQPEELQGKTTAVLIGDDSYGEFINSMPEAGNSSIRKELLVTTKSGKAIHIEITAFPIVDKNGSVIYRVGFARDMTNRRKAELALQRAHDELELRVAERTAELARVNETLRESEAKNTALIDAIPDLIVRLSSDGTFLDYKPAGNDDFILQGQQVVGKNIAAVWGQNLADDTMKLVKQALETREMQITEYRLEHQDHLHYFEARIVVNGPAEVLGIVRDITERKETEAALQRAHEDLEIRVTERTAELAKSNEDLREAQAQLIQSEKMAALGMLVAGIAHEINTPVGAINSMHNTLVRAVTKLKAELEKDGGPKIQENRKLSAIFDAMTNANRVISSGTERVITIVRRLRSFARLDEAALKDADIHAGIEDTLVLIHHEIKHGISVEKDYGKLPIIPHFPGKLNQVLLNLMINAKQAILARPEDSDKGLIGIKTEHLNQEIIIRISDNGVGIPEANLRKIFDPGFTTKGVGVGTGLGLSIVYQIIQEDHRGRISVESEVGKGTTFTIRIPDNLDQILEHT